MLGERCRYIIKDEPRTIRARYDFGGLAGQMYAGIVIYNRELRPIGHLDGAAFFAKERKPGWKLVVLLMDVLPRYLLRVRIDARAYGWECLPFSKGGTLNGS